MIRPEKIGRLSMSSICQQTVQPAQNQVMPFSKISLVAAPEGTPVQVVLHAADVEEEGRLLTWQANTSNETSLHT